MYCSMRICVWDIARCWTVNTWDVEMPGEDVWSMIRDIQARRIQLYILAMTKRLVDFKADLSATREYQNVKHFPQPFAPKPILYNGASTWAVRTRSGHWRMLGADNRLWRCRRRANRSSQHSCFCINSVSQCKAGCKTPGSRPYQAKLRSRLSMTSNPMASSIR